MKRFLASAILAFLFAGCASPCVQLAEEICNCQPTQSDRDNCNSNVSARADQVAISDTDNDTCSSLLNSCACYELDTPQGKKNCGLAR